MLNAQFLMLNSHSSMLNSLEKERKCIWTGMFKEKERRTRSHWVFAAANRIDQRLTKQIWITRKYLTSVVYILTRCSICNIWRKHQKQGILQSTNNEQQRCRFPVLQPNSIFGCFNFWNFLASGIIPHCQRWKLISQIGSSWSLFFFLSCNQSVITCVVS